jgi:hypothetical protein
MTTGSKILIGLMIAASLVLASCGSAPTVSESSSSMLPGWELVSVSDAGNYYYIKTDSIKKEGKTTLAWAAINYSAPRKGYSGAGYYQSMSQLNRYDCVKKQSKLLSLSYFSEMNLRGEVLFSQSLQESDEPWNYIEPDSVGEYIFIRVCET